MTLSLRNLEQSALNESILIPNLFLHQKYHLSSNNHICHIKARNKRKYWVRQRRMMTPMMNSFSGSSLRINRSKTGSRTGSLLIKMTGAIQVSWREDDLIISLTKLFLNENQELGNYETFIFLTLILYIPITSTFAFSLFSSISSMVFNWQLFFALALYNLINFFFFSSIPSD